jgi:hypothetical protein
MESLRFGYTEGVCAVGTGNVCNLQASLQASRSRRELSVVARFYHVCVSEMGAEINANRFPEFRH